jgi:hypothetical protein
MPLLVGPLDVVKRSIGGWSLGSHLVRKWLTAINIAISCRPNRSLREITHNQRMMRSRASAGYGAGERNRNVYAYLNRSVLALDRPRCVTGIGARVGVASNVENCHVVRQHQVPEQSFLVVITAVVLSARIPDSAGATIEIGVI